MAGKVTANMLYDYRVVIVVKKTVLEQCLALLPPETDSGFRKGGRFAGNLRMNCVAHLIADSCNIAVQKEIIYQ